MKNEGNAYIPLLVVADAEEIKRKLRDLKARIASTQESIEKVRQRIASTGPEKKKSKKTKSKD